MVGLLALPLLLTLPAGCLEEPTRQTWPPSPHDMSPEIKGVDTFDATPDVHSITDAGAPPVDQGEPLTCTAPASTSGKAATVIIAPDDDWVAALSRLGPGDIAELQAGVFDSSRYSYAERVLQLRGEAGRPIVIRGAGERETVLHGGSESMILSLEGCQHLIIENVVLQNPSADGDGRTDKLQLGDGHRLCEALKIKGGNDITIRGCRFEHIGTRGLLVSRLDDPPADVPDRVERLTVEDNLFFNVGLDTASGDININAGTDWAIRYNLFGGNVDGVVLQRAGSGGLVTRNVFVNHWQEDNIDFKYHRDGGWSTIRDNVLYGQRAKTSITVQDESQNVRVVGNVIRGGSHTAQIWVHGRGDEPALYPVKDVELSDNWLVSDGSHEALEVRPAADKGPDHRPVSIERVTFFDNFLEGHGADSINSWGDVDLQLHNNAFASPPVARAEAFEQLERQIYCRLEKTFTRAELSVPFEEAELSYPPRPNLAP